MSESARRRALETLYQKILRDARLIMGMWPAERIPLSRLLEMDKPIIRLSGGGKHLIDRKELEDFARRIPWFMHELVKLPIVIVYRREDYGSVYRVDGDKWAARAVSILTGGDFTQEKWVLSGEEVSELLRRYKTLFFVTIQVELRGVVESDWY